MTVVDVHKGWCSSCRSDQHDLCTRDRFGGKCACDEHKAPARPEPVKAAAPARPVPGPTTNGQTPAPAKPSVVRWEDPPPKRTALAPISEAVEAELRAHPNRWGRVRDYKSVSGASGAAKAIRLGKHGLAVADWQCEVRASHNPSGSTLYVRFVGRGGASS